MNSPSRRSTLTIALCFIVALIEGFDLQAAGTTAAGLRHSFALDPKMLGWVFSVGIIGLLPGAFFGGWIADRIGRKKILVMAVLLFGLFSLSTAFVDSYGSLLLVRFLTGLGLGAALPNLIALCAEAVSERNRGTAISVMYCGVPLGGALAAVVAMFSSEHWQTTFIIGGLAPLLAVPLMILLLPESSAFRQQSPTTPGARASTRQALFGEGRARTTLALWLSYFFTLTVMYMLLNWLPSLLLEQGFSKPQAGMVQMLFNIGGALGSLLGGVLLEPLQCAQGGGVRIRRFAGRAGGCRPVGGHRAHGHRGLRRRFVRDGRATGAIRQRPALLPHCRARHGCRGGRGHRGDWARWPGRWQPGNYWRRAPVPPALLLATSPGVVIAALTIISVMVRTAP